MKHRHRLEPWAAEQTEYCGSMLTSVLSGTYIVAPMQGEGDIARANGERIVACVNACEGIADPGVVPEMLAALKFVSEDFHQTSAVNGGLNIEAFQAVQKVIARAEGRDATRT